MAINKFLEKGIQLNDKNYKFANNYNRDIIVSNENNTIIVNEENLLDEDECYRRFYLENSELSDFHFAEDSYEKIINNTYNAHFLKLNNAFRLLFEDIIKVFKIDKFLNFLNKKLLK
jgi:hypothetical protein